MQRQSHNVVLLHKKKKKKKEIKILVVSTVYTL